MKIILDTNVLVAAFATQGLCHAVFEVCLDQHEIVLSEQILTEFTSSLKRKLKVPTRVIDNTVQFLKDHTSVGKAPKLSRGVSRDASDDHLLFLAEGTKASYIITGDQDPLILKSYRKIPIVQPRKFWEILRRAKA